MVLYKLSHSQALQDLVLFVAVLVIVAIDLIIILIGSVIPQSRLIATKTEDTQHPQTTTVSNFHMFYVKYFVMLYTTSFDQQNSLKF